MRCPFREPPQALKHEYVFFWKKDMGSPCPKAMMRGVLQKYMGSTDEDQTETNAIRILSASKDTYNAKLKSPWVDYPILSTAAR